MASLEQSLQRLGLDYVDIYYSHRYDEETPLEETEGLHVLLDLFNFGRTEQNTGHDWVAQDPGQSHLQQSLATILRDLD